MNHHSPRPLLLMITLAVVLAGPGIGVKKNPPFLTISTAYSMTPLAALVVKPKVELTDKRVSLLDLCDQTDLPEDWKLLLSGVDITSTPEEGTEKYINPEQLRIFVQHLIESHGLDKESIKISIPERITILRKEIRLTAPQIEEIFRQFILSKVPWRAEDIVVHDISCPDAAVLPEGSVTHEIVPPPNERYLGNVTLPIRFYVNGKLARSIEVSGKVDLYQNLVYTRNPMKRNDVITETTFRWSA